MEEQRPRAADDFAAIRARLKELRRERERAEKAAIAQKRSGPTDRVGWPRSSGH